MRLDGKVAMITGGGQGIGEAIAKRFAADGAKVLINDIKKDLLDEVAGSMKPGMVATCIGDVTKLDDVKQMVKETLDFGGKIDVLVNNAGIDPPGTIVDVDVDRWRDVLDANLTGPFLCMKTAIPYMIKQGGGSIITIASLAGVRCLRNMAAYCASKAGVIQLARQAALEYGKQGIRSNIVAPGATRTKMLIEAMRKPSEKLGRDAFEVLAQPLPLHRTAEPFEITGVCSFLASDDSAFITGALLMVDGGAAIVDASGAALDIAGARWD
jgi:meso-butanediol dehydrogenase/(S,S)-butanediol dehydrogenase/diacetyl reductase